MDTASVKMNNLDAMTCHDIRVNPVALRVFTRPTPGGYCGLRKEVDMPYPVVLLMKRASNCPLACFLKILFFLLILVALYLAVYHQTSVSLPWYLLLLGIIGVESAFMLFANNNCRTRRGESPD